MLVVDDYREIATQIAHVIERAGSAARGAFGGREGLAAFNAALSASAAFSAVVTDFRVTDLNGLALAAAVKAASPATPVVLVTASAIDSQDELRQSVDARLSRSGSPARSCNRPSRLIVLLTKRVSEPSAAERHRRSSSWTPN